jgi:hypothetical protein
MNIKIRLTQYFQRYPKAWIALIVACIFPLIILINALQGQGILSLIYFGKNYQYQQTKALQEVNIPRVTPYGYDGQMYAQLALDPLLIGDAVFDGIDNPAYRARRIAMPLLAFLMGHGELMSILYSYALLNFVTWVLFALTLLRYLSPKNWSDIALIAALLISSGTLISLMRALTDFPAAALGISALLISQKGKISTLMLAFSALFKETSLLSFGALVFPRTSAPAQRNKQLFKLVFILLAPFSAWSIYLFLRTPAIGEIGPAGNFDWPLFSLLHKYQQLLVWEHWERLMQAWAPLPKEMRRGYLVLTFFELLAPLSLAIQAGYIFHKWRWSNPYWGFGLGFALLFLVIGDSIWLEQYAYCRVLLPLSFAFNFLIRDYESGKKYWTLFIAGNLGLMGIPLILLTYPLISH